MSSEPMTDEHARKRNEFANALFAVAELAKSVPASGWDYPIPYIIENCRKWANGYRVKGWKPATPAPDGKWTSKPNPGGAYLCLDNLEIAHIGHTASKDFTDHNIPERGEERCNWLCDILNKSH